MGEGLLALGGGLAQGYAQGQQQAQGRNLQKQQLDIAQKRLKIEEEESALKMTLLQHQIQQQGGIMSLLEKFLGQGQGQGQMQAPGIEAPEMGQPVPPMMPSPQGGMVPAPQAGGLQLEGVNIGKEGPSLRLGRPEKPSDTDRLALSIFGRPFVQLDQAQQQEVLRREQSQKVQVSAAQGAAGLVAKTEAGLDLPLSAEDLTKLTFPGGRSLPFGITPRQAIEAGAIPIAAAEQAQKIALQATESILNRLDELTDKIFPEGEGFQARLQAAVTNKTALLRQDQDPVLYESLKEGILANIVRTFGERGTLTDQDIARARALLGDFAGRPLPDTRGVARGKHKQLRELIKEISQRKPLSQPVLQQPQPQPSGKKANGKLRFNPQTGRIE